MPGTARISRLEGKLVEIEGRRRQSAAMANALKLDSVKLREHLDRWFSPPDDTDPEMWKEMTEEDRRELWPAWEMRRILVRMEELKMVSTHLEGQSCRLTRLFFEWLDVAGEGKDGEPIPLPWPIDCRALHEVKFAVRCNFGNFAEFGIDKARQIDHLTYHPSKENEEEIRRRIEETGSFPPDPLPAFP